MPCFCYFRYTRPYVQGRPYVTDEALISRGSNQSLACFVWSCISKLTSFPIFNFSSFLFIFGKSSQGSFVTLYLFCMWSSFIVNEMCAKFQVHIYINLYPSLREGRKNVSLQTVNGPLTNRFLTVNVNVTFEGEGGGSDTLMFDV